MVKLQDEVKGIAYAILLFLVLGIIYFLIL
jgi:hypothetical protein